jgi:Yip1 domain
MASTPTFPSPQQAPASAGSFGRMIGVFFTPRQTFGEIARQPNWVVPLLVMTLISLCLSWAINKRVDWRQVTEDRIEQSRFASSRMDQLPPDQRRQAIDRQAASAPITRYVRGAVGTALLALILGVVYFGVFNLLAGAGVSFSQAYSLIMYTLLPIALKELIEIPILFIKDPSTIDPDNFLASNPAAILSNIPAWEKVLLGSFDLFSLWGALLVAVAFSAANPKKVSFGKALGLVAAVYIGLTLLFTGILAPFS